MLLNAINWDENVWADNLQFLTGLNFVISVGEKLNKLENLNDRLSSRQTGHDDDGCADVDIPKGACWKSLGYSACVDRRYFWINRTEYTTRLA